MGHTMPLAGPFYFLSGSEGNVSLPSLEKKDGNVATYWSKKLGIDLVMPQSESTAPIFTHQDQDLDPEEAHRRVLNGGHVFEDSAEVACPSCGEHVGIEAPFDDAYECPYCASEFEFEPESVGAHEEHFDWYSADREKLLSAIANNTASASHEVLEHRKGRRGETMLENIFGTLFGLWFALGFTLFSGLGLMMLPLTLFGDSEVPLLLALVFSVIGFFTFIPSVKFVLQLLGGFFSPETLERYTRTQYYDSTRKYIAWVEQIVSPSLGRQGSTFVLSETILGDAHALKAYTVYYSEDSGHGGGGGG